MVLGALVGAMLAGSGAAYQGVFRNPLADPYLLGVAAGGGLGATMIIITGANTALLPPAAFAGAVGAVALTYFLGASASREGGAPGAAASASIVLAGVAVAALLTAVQTYLQQQHTPDLQAVYSWILGGLAVATWSDIGLVLPYLVVAAGVLLAHRRLLRKRSGQHQPLRLAAGQRRQRSARHRGQLQAVQQVAADAAVGGGLHAQVPNVRGAAQQHVVTGRHLRRQNRRLRHVGNQPRQLTARQPRDRAAADGDLPVMPGQARHTAKQGRLAGSVRPDHGQPFAVRHPLADPGQGHRCAVADPHPLDADHARS